ncbi:polysaccharide lyase family 14 protein, partial [Fomitiporia mediterranea MF3/22]|uniref:polysaccharide lyase family 14 protein n=1 Tax=Fomitiporia mediterranea (strain MF3/22) TaxID=694068 RepID=UPI0004409C22
FSDLDSFKIAHFACGEHNLRITKGIPPDAFDESLAIDLPGIDEDMEALYSNHFSNASSALQLFYPENSINPANWPQGGADFYATPLPLADASNVTLEYSVFFPKGFDWVQGGKLPGLYGGHMTCSGGDDASLCFSTRLMWRAGGSGELYLYAPKDRQTYALCHAPPQSVCNAEYGLSVGRGSFKFTPGAWTSVRQTVTLNTPGKQDGTFLLEVNGKTVMDRHDVYYRDEAPSPTSTFFGGNSKDFATPKDQYTWFKDFAITINA